MGIYICRSIFVMSVGFESRIQALVMITACIQIEHERKIKMQLQLCVSGKTTDTLAHI